MEEEANDGEKAREELKVKLEIGAAQAEAGELLDGDRVFEEIREIIEERRRTGKKPSLR